MAYFSVLLNEKKFFLFEKLLIMSINVDFYLSLTQNGLLWCTSIGDKCSRFEKLLIIPSILTFQMSLTLKMAYFGILPLGIGSVDLTNC